MVNVEREYFDRLLRSLGAYVHEHNVEQYRASIVKKLRRCLTDHRRDEMHKVKQVFQDPGKCLRAFRSGMI